MHIADFSSHDTCPISAPLRLTMNAILQLSICCTSKRNLSLTQARDTRAKFSPIPKRDPCLTYLSPNPELKLQLLLTHTTTQPKHHSSHRTNKMESDVQDQPTTSPSEHLLNKYLPLPYRVATLIVLGMPTCPSRSASPPVEQSN